MEVRANEGVLRIEARIEAPGTREQVWQLLTDFGRLAEFMPNVDSSRVLSRTDSSVLVREVVSSQLVRPWTFAFILEYIPLEPSELRFHQVAGQLKGYEGVWLLEPRGEYTAVSYQARVGYRRVPGFLAAYIVRRQLGRMMPALAAEMKRRTGGG
ncbi:MAG: SRPBCC family protein [Candidatus Latescibacteria bacterium]|nr:SRPBCC family protein [Candidatus Latescibacterota bacterium]